MKIGTQKLKYTVETILYENHIINGRRRIANEIVDTIMELIGGDMNLEWNLGHGFPQDLEKVVRELERGLGLNMPRDTDAAETYRWIKEQAQNGRPVSKFIVWALDVDASHPCCHPDLFVADNPETQPALSFSAHPVYTPSPPIRRSWSNAGV